MKCGKKTEITYLRLFVYTLILINLSRRIFSLPTKTHLILCCRSFYDNCHYKQRLCSRKIDIWKHLFPCGRKKISRET